MQPYKTLNVSLDADSETIRQARMDAIRQHPPESDPDTFNLINLAFDQIDTEDKRIKREIGAAPKERHHMESPLEAFVAFLQADIHPFPPAEDDFYNFLKS